MKLETSRKWWRCLSKLCWLLLLANTRHRPMRNIQYTSHLNDSGLAFVFWNEKQVVKQVPKTDYSWAKSGSEKITHSTGDYKD